MNTPLPDSASHSLNGHGNNRNVGSSLLHAINIVRRRRKVLLMGFLVGGGFAMIFAATRPRTYRSEAILEVGPDKPIVHTEGVGESTSRSSPLWENHFRTQEALLRRPGLLEQVIESMPPEFAAPYKASADPARRLSEDLAIDAVPSTFLIRVSLNHDRPDPGPAIVNNLVERFIEDSNRRLKELKIDALDILNKESLPLIKKRKEEAENSLWAFQNEIGFGDLEEQYAAMLAEKRAFQDRLLAIRMRTVELLAGPESGLAAGAEGGEAAAVVARRLELEIELARQKQLLREGHPAIKSLVAQIEGLDTFLLQRRERNLRLMREEERTLLDEERKMGARMAKTRAQLARYKDLEIEVSASRDLYNSYVKRQGEVKATSGAGLANVRVVEKARLPIQAGPKLHLILALGLIVGTAIGLLAVLLAEQIDDRVPTPTEAEAALGLELLSVIPQFPTPAGSPDQPLVPEDDPVTAPLEPFRRLRSEVASRMQSVQGTKTVSILSPNYGEGKSTIAINFARVLALEGKRVLLFDVDLRQPCLKSFLANRNSPGLEDYLDGKAVLDRCLQPSRFPGVDVFGATSEFAGAAEVSGTPRFRNVWAALRENYDYVIVDTSPINVVSEAAVVAAHADASIFVMEEQRTGLRQAIAALRRIGNHKVRPLGLVVNRSQVLSFTRPEADQPPWGFDHEVIQKKVGAVLGHIRVHMRRDVLQKKVGAVFGRIRRLLAPRA